MTAPIRSAPQSAARGRTISARLIALLLLIPCLGVLVVAASLDPNPQGMGTHQQMGLPPCGFLASTGLPCATCGMTTAFSHAAHGDFAAAFAVQPAGMALALLTAMGVVTFAYAAVSGASLMPMGALLWRPRMGLLLGGTVILGWTYTLAAALLN